MVRTSPLKKKKGRDGNVHSCELQLHAYVLGAIGQGQAMHIPRVHLGALSQKKLTMPLPAAVVHHAPRSHRIYEYRNAFPLIIESETHFIKLIKFFFSSLILLLFKYSSLPFPPTPT